MKRSIVPNFATSSRRVVKSSNHATVLPIGPLDDPNTGQKDYPNTGQKDYLKKRYDCCCKGGMTADQILTVLAAVTIICTIVAVVFGIVFASRADSLQRFAVRATPEAVVGGPVVAEPGALAVGLFSLYSVEREIEYAFQFENTSTITAIHVRGPITPGSGQVGPFKFALCGSPSSTVCDVTTTPNFVGAVVDQILPGATSPRPEITAIREDPSAYYLEFLTNDNPTTPGALRGNLDGIVGTP